MLKLILSVIFYIISYSINLLLITYLTVLEKKKCECVGKNANFHFSFKNSLYVALLMPIVYITLLGFAHLTKDKQLKYSLNVVYQILMVLINGIISVMLFTYIQLLIKKDDCKCITEKKRIAKIHKTVHILSYVMLIIYTLYLGFYIYYKYIYEPKVVLINNVNNVRGNKINNMRGNKMNNMNRKNNMNKN